MSILLFDIIVSLCGYMMKNAEVRDVSGYDLKFLHRMISELNHKVVSE